MSGLRVDNKETLLTTVIDAVPDIREPIARPSIWPLVGAIATATLFICSIFSPWAVVWGAIPVTAALIAWFWPKTVGKPLEPVID